MSNIQSFLMRKTESHLINVNNLEHILRITETFQTEKQRGKKNIALKNCGLKGII